MSSSEYTPLRSGGNTPLITNGNGNGSHTNNGNGYHQYGNGSVNGSMHRDHKVGSIWWTQFQALLRKNYQVLKRQWKSTSYFVLGPIAFLIIILIVTTAVKNANDTESGRYDIKPLSLDKCQSLDVYGNVYPRVANPCISVIYAPLREPYTSIMNDVRQSLGWDEYDVQGFATTDVMMSWMFENMGLGDMIVNFNRTLTQAYIPPGPLRVSYEIWRNITGSDLRAAALQSTVDLSILKVLNNQTNTNTNTKSAYHDRHATAGSGKGAGIFDDLIHMEETDEDREIAIAKRRASLGAAGVNIQIQMIPPVISPRTSSIYDDFGDQASDELVIAIGLNLSLVVAITVAALLIVQTVTTEKKDKLLGRMRIMGLSESAYWFTWFLSYLVIALIVALFIPAIGQATKFAVYVRTNYLVHVLVMFMFMFSIFALALCVSSCVKQPRWVNVASIIFFFAATFSSSFPIAEQQNMWYSPQLPNIVTFIFWCMPWFHFNKSMGDIIRHTRSQLLNEGTVNQTRVNPTFDIDNLYDQQWGSFQCYTDKCCAEATDDDICWTAPSVSYALSMQFCVALVYFTLAWYFSQLGGDLGASQRWYFPVSSSYWGCGKKKTREGLVEGDTLSREQIQSKEQRSVRTYKISKAFKDQSAVKEVSLQMDRGECFVLLGHNGAGKTTMINMLTGLFPPTYGEGFIFGMDIRNDTTQIQQTMGICPQEDWLWPELTSFEHLLLFAALRGLPRNIWPQAIAAKLAEFHLNDLINTPTAKLSGGMKRRLSLALATLGAPEIIFLDEPTTGMDPVNKHKVWNAIAAMKRDRVIVLTTHSMEEADFLGDKVAMMSGGRLRAMGTSLFLKNHFGAGYQIHLLSSPSNIPQLEQVVKDVLPSAEIVGNAGGNLTVALPRKAVRLIPDFFRWIDQAKKSAENGILVKEWSISNSTLEEVFLRLCSTEKGINEVGTDFSKQKAEEENKRMCVLCNEREAQMVTVYTKSGVAVQCPNLICMRCCMGAELDEEEKKLKEIEEGGMFGNDTNKMPVDPRAITFVVSDDEKKSSSSSSCGASSMIAATANEVAAAATIASDSVNINGNGNGIGQRGGLKDAVGVRPPTVCQQVRAVFLKNFALSLTEKKTWITKLLLLILFAVLMSLDLSPAAQNSTCPQGWQRNDYNGYPCDRASFVKTWLAKDYRALQNWDFLGTFLYDYTKREYREVPSWSAWSQSPNHVWFTDSPVAGDTPLNQWDMASMGPGVMNRTDYIFFTSHADITSDLAVGRKIVQDRATTSPYSWCRYYGDQWFARRNIAEAKQLAYSMFGDTFLTMSRSKPSELRMDYTIAMWNQDANYGGNPYPFGISTNDSYCNTFSAPTRPWQSLPYMVNGMSNAMGNTVLGKDLSIGTTVYVYRNSKWNAQLQLSTIAKALSALSFITMLLWPTFVYRIIYEREERLFHMMRISGMKTSTYWLANYSFDMMMQVIWSVFFLVIPTALGAEVIVRPGIAIHALVLICFAHAMMGMTTFFSALFTSRRAASVVGYLFVIVISSLAPLFSLQLTTWPAYLFILPPIAYMRALDLAIRYGSDAFVNNSDMALSIAMLLVMGTVWLFVGIYLNTIKYRSKLFIFDACRPAKRRSHARAVREARAAATADNGGASYQGGALLAADDMKQRYDGSDDMDGDISMHGKMISGLNADQLAKEDIDVRAERKRILDGSWGKVPPAIVIRNLVKSFTKSGTEKNDKLAVNHICLGIDQGECFGLLGPNGAGKTTTLSILSGLLDQTRGTVRVGAYDTRTEIDLVYTILGICPQFDTVWEDLSIRDHFLFYARLKGATPEYEAALAQQQAEMVDLDGDAFNKPANSLSGGMKRRLSIGISLIGNPKVWLLDEPSTGLSPEARRQVWDIVSKQRKVGRTVIITTHSMEEADTLCSRIGIVAKGQLKCLGTQSHLKARFGDGFKLVFNLDHVTTRRIESSASGSHNGHNQIIDMDHKNITRDNELDGYVVNDLTCRGAVLTGAVGKNMVYTLPKDGATTEDVLRIFNAMERKQKELKSRFGVVEWGVQQSSLEEVFISVVDQADRDEDAANGITGNAKRRDDQQQLEVAEIARLTNCC